MINKVDEQIEYYLEEISTISKNDIYNKMGCLFENFSKL